MGDSRHEWMQPGAHEVAPGVHRIPLPLPNDGLRAVNVYAITDGDALTLVDGGWALAEAREQLSAGLRQIGAGLGDIRRFLVTHAHRDHYTQAVALRREYGSRVLLGEGERPTLQVLMRPDHVALEKQVELLAGCGAKPVLDAVIALRGEKPRTTGWEEPDEWITESTDVGLTDRPLRALPTPGHTRGHVVFIDDGTGLLFAGDHVLPHITPSIGFEQAPSELPLRDYMASLRLVRALPDMRLLPAHGPVTDSAHQRIDELLDHHDRRLAATAAVVERGASTAYEVARGLTWTRREHALDDMDPYNQMLAVLETAAHLDVLVLQARLRAETVDEVKHYAPA
ncbi:Glyoxylase, beta-lactamase superfamily II [Saccharopolyspora antimicrobica]|uniref:Glyoxylase, beta-lactamase superfamily II n=1 Tax=Saccharopolyspora antimicrobica TaxID=455193 RepID=A0A1I4S409_9PSEU|nr:MBL fold metallo-hydrolase [Saccharopolyspora antimicrobica]RKT87578.1 glyoxylase-like metal-dependent hydrolase (beta-lactamase superfamily II) [Saccharopolyspora antimicrobica]SFM59205.1 Glyoxylase, beta-lactamase superfamily II [Saccharopolyspora antimicrobica]